MRYNFLFIFFFFPYQIFASNVHFSKRHSIGHYKVNISWDEKLDGERVTIKKSGKTVLSKGEPGSHFWIGSHFGELRKKKDPFLGKDITGDGIPELIISQWNGGAHCCHFLHIYELGMKLRKLTTIDGGSNGFEIRDIDNDGVPEIEFYDWPIDYIFNCFAESAQARTILKFVDGTFRTSAKSMYKRRPNDKKLSEMKRTIKQDFIGMGDRVPYTLLSLMMDLSYTGYKELAIRIAKETWPSERGDFAKFKQDFMSMLQDSVYWTEFNLGKY